MMKMIYLLWGERDIWKDDCRERYRFKIDQSIRIIKTFAGKSDDRKSIREWKREISFLVT